MEMLVGMVLIAVVVIIIYLILKFRKLFKKNIKNKTISSFKCLDGHVVRSKGELIIDNYLHFKGIKHLYEKTIKVHGHPIKYDWFLPKYRVYIEYWGFYGKAYEKRKAEKLRLYKKGKLKLISIENMMFGDIYKNLERELQKFGVTSISYEATKHCPNCGINLDDRFENHSKIVSI